MSIRLSNRLKPQPLNRPEPNFDVTKSRRPQLTISILSRNTPSLPDYKYYCFDRSTVRFDRSTVHLCDYFLRLPAYLNVACPQKCMSLTSSLVCAVIY